MGDPATFVRQLTRFDVARGGESLPGTASQAELYEDGYPLGKHCPYHLLVSPVH